VSDLVSVIAPLVTGFVPLQTLPGWPTVPEVSLVDNLVWILLIPGAVAIVVAVIALTAARGKEDPSLHPPTEAEPLMIGGNGPNAPALTAGGAKGEGSTGGSHASW